MEKSSSLILETTVLTASTVSLLAGHMPSRSFELGFERINLRKLVYFESRVIFVIFLTTI
jgi:hypothetical protein